ncbi:MAG: hypothetical protein H6982_16955 [Chromatiales bacterium]|nr:hypothetical protein [Chromatiales bacterium]
MNATKAKVFTLIRRLSLGLDYWGNSEFFVPHLRFEYLLEETQELLVGAAKFEELGISYRDASTQWEKQKGVLREALRNHEITTARVQEQISRASETEAQLVTEIEKLATAYEPTWSALMQASETMRRAISRETNGCEFGEVLKVVATISTAVATAGTGLGVALTAAQTFAHFKDRKGPAGKQDAYDKLGEFGEAKYKLDKLVAAGSGVASIANAAREITNVLDQTPSDMPVLPSDEQKIPRRNVPNWRKLWNRFGTWTKCKSIRRERRVHRPGYDREQ